MARKRKDTPAGAEWHLHQHITLITRSINQMTIVYFIPMQASRFVTTQQTLTFAITDICLSLSKQQQYAS